MSNPIDPAAPEPAPVPPAAPARRRSWKTPVLVAAIVAAGFSAAAATSAFSQGFGPFGGGHGGFGGGGFGGGMGWHQGGGFRGGALDPAEREKRVERMVKHLAVEVDATAEQQAKLIQIAQSATRDLAPMREKVQAARQKARGLLTQPNLDRAAIELFRAEQMALADQASRRAAQAIGEAAEALTPDQRQKLGDRLDRFPRFQGGGRRG